MSLLQKLRIKRFNYLSRKLDKILQKIGLENISENESEAVIDWDKITKISEELNKVKWDFTLYMDTTKLLPGFIVYVIGKRPPTAEKPYITYKPEPRVVSSIHDSGINGGTVFFTYSHRIEKPQSITKSETDFTVVSEEDVIYSPLTKGHAEYICKLLNLQSKRLYEKNLLKIQNKQNEK